MLRNRRSPRSSNAKGELRRICSEKRAAHVDRIGVGGLLNAGGEVNAIADEVVVLHQHIGEVQAKAHAQGADVALLRQRQRGRGCPRRIAPH